VCYYTCHFWHGADEVPKSPKDSDLCLSVWDGGNTVFLEKKEYCWFDVHMDNDTCISEEEYTINPFLLHK
jgi:hypothetical protein